MHAHARVYLWRAERAAPAQDEEVDEWLDLLPPRPAAAKTRDPAAKPKPNGQVRGHRRRRTTPFWRKQDPCTATKNPVRWCERERPAGGWPERPRRQVRVAWTFEPEKAPSTNATSLAELAAQKVRPPSDLRAS
jgi:hypothetical protein